MSSISFMNGIAKVNKENHFNALSLLVYTHDTNVLISCQYLYGAIDVSGQNGATYFTTSSNYLHHTLLIKLQNYFDQQKPMSM